MQFVEYADLGLVSALVTLGYSPEDRRKEGRQVIFSFESSDKIKEIENDFFNSKLSVPDVRGFHITMKSIKNSIWNERTK